MTIQEISAKLVEHLRKGDFEGAQKELLADDAASIEPAHAPMGSVTGRDQIIAKGHQFMAMIEKVHGLTVSDPIIAGQFFSVALLMDVEMKGMGRQQMDEILVYHVKDGKIQSEQYFYHLG